MAKQTLPTNFVDDIIAPSMGGKRKFTITDNGDGTYEIEDVTEYAQTGSDYGAGQINATNQAVNESCDKANVIDSLDDIVANQASGMIAGAKAVAELNDKTYDKTEGTLGLASRTYILKRYHDGTFELNGRADTSKIHMQYSESSKKYFASLTVSLPDELNLADDRYIFTGGTESGGLYDVSLVSIYGRTMTIYLSANNYTGEIPIVKIGFNLNGHWK